MNTKRTKRMNTKAHFTSPRRPVSQGCDNLYAVEVHEAARDLVHTRVRTEFSYYKAKQRLRDAIEDYDNATP